MSKPQILDPVEYLVIGHIVQDLTPQGLRLGGTAAYSALTARALGLRVGVVTAVSEGTSLEPLGDIPIVRIESPDTTTFENIYTRDGRIQYLRAQASPIDFDMVPDAWRQASIIHLGPLTGELHPVLPAGFSPKLLGLTPQGWMREWDAEGRVSPRVWQDAGPALAAAGAVAISREDVDGDEELIEAMAQRTAILAVTEGAAGSVLYWHGDRRRFHARQMEELDATGAGDIFAAAFFFRLFTTRDPWEAARFATLLASHTVTRPGLDGVPTPGEIRESMIEVLQ